MDPFLGEIRLCAFSFAPRGWAFCNGALLPVRQNQALFALLGITYGGDGVNTFGLPDLRGRTAVSAGPSQLTGTNYTQGAQLGTETVTLTSAQVPSHSHLLQVSTSAGTSATIGAAVNIPATSSVTAPAVPEATYGDASSNLTAMSSRMCQLSGGNQPHANVQASLVLNYIIATQGIFPSRN